jgi:hypothetical protein
MNPYAPPTASLEPAPAAPVTPQQAADIQAQIKSLNARSFLLAIPGFVLQVVGRGMPGIAGVAVTLLGAALIVGGLVFYAKMRGRGPLFGLLGLASCLGLLILYFLPKSCLNCKTSHAYSAKQCKRCGAPLGA